METEGVDGETGFFERVMAAGRREWPVLLIALAATALAFYHPAWAIAGLVVVVAAIVLRIVVAEAPESTQIPVISSARPETAVTDHVSALDLAAAVPDPLIIFDATSALSYANDAARRAFGPLQEGMPMLLKYRAPEMQELLSSVIGSSDGPRRVEYVERVPVDASYLVTAGSIGAGSGLFFLLFKDQSEARRIDRMRADFIANASHEMRTPLASISGFVETLRGPAKDDPAARERFLKIMQEQTGRMSRLIDDLLSLSRLEMKSHGKPAEPVDVRSVVQSVIDSLKPLAKDLSVAIHTDFAAGDLLVSGDRDELFQVFENLVENACKYGQTGGRVDVSISSQGEGGQQQIRVAIRDFGPGIPEEHIPRLTERFYRVDVQSSRAQKGTGLGLSIVKHILTRHDGRLSIKSEVGQGAEFTVILPARQIA